MKKVLFFASVIFLFQACSSADEVRPKIDEIEELVFASGQLEWDDAYNITAQTEGILSGIEFEIGSFVEKGSQLTFISNENNEVNLKIAQEQLEIANQNLDNQAPLLQQIKENIAFAESKYNQDKIQLDRFEKLYTTNTISKLELENAQLNAKNSKANLSNQKKQFEQQLIIAKQQQISQKGQTLNNKIILDYNTIKAFEEGTIIKKFKNNGDYVKKGDVIASIANSKKVEAVLNVDESSITKVKLGQLVYIQFNTDKNKVYEGKVSEILSAFENQSQSFICKVNLNEKLKSNLYGTQLEANILVNKKQHVLLIPRDYLGYGNKVNTKNKGELTVKTGIISTEFVEVISGINQNDILLPLKLK